MKILLINHFPLEGSGSGVYTINVAKSLVEKKHKACIIFPENTTKIIKLENIKVHPVYFKLKEKIPGQVNFNFGCMDPHPRSNLLFSEMNQEQINKYKEAFKIAIEEEIEKFKPDIIHAQHIWIISSVAVKYNIPVVITSHGSGIMGYEDAPKFRKYSHQAVLGCKKIIAISEQNVQEIKRLFPEGKDKIIKILNGYDPKIFYLDKIEKKDVLKKLGINHNCEKIVCFVGRITENKGLDILIKAARIYQKGNIATLIIGAGDPKIIEKLKKLKKKMGIKEVFFLGYKNHEEIRKIYNISDVLVVPSEKEAFGLVALEAIACGTPIVATKNGGFIDFVNKDVGLLLNNRTVEEFAKGIQYVLENEKKYQRINLAKYAQEKYTQEKTIENIIEIYKNSI